MDATSRGVKDIWENRAPLLAGLLSHAAEGYLSYHTPGHKQGQGALAEWRHLLGDNVFQMDLTELPGLDNLQDPQGIIRKAQEAAASYFGAKETFFLVNGTTAGILAVLMAKSRPGSKVVLPRTSHQAVIHGIIFSGAQPVYLPVRSHTTLGLPGHITSMDLESCLAELDQDALIVLLHPNYYGLAGELRQQVLAAHCHKNCAVLVDEAHGAHFGISPFFPVMALRAGADFAAQGAHKVLGSFTQSAFLHCQGESDLEKIRDVLRMVQSSSPSYLLMASLDVARCQCQQEKERWESSAQLGEELRLEISRIPGIYAPGEELLEVPGVVEYDPIRLVINVRELGITGFEAAEWLRREHKILVEMADFQNLVLILGPASGQRAADLLLEGLGSMAAACSTRGSAGCFFPDPLQLPIPRQVMTPRDAFFAPHSLVSWENAQGKIAAEVVAPYPPGVPVICPGERIGEEVLDFLQGWEAAGGVWPGKSRGLIKIATGS